VSTVYILIWNLLVIFLLQLVYPGIPTIFIQQVIGHVLCLKSTELHHAQQALSEDLIIQQRTGGDISNILLYWWQHIQDACKWSIWLSLPVCGYCVWVLTFTMTVLRIKKPKQAVDISRLDPCILQHL
jgi:hypothetical protein